MRNRRNEGFNRCSWKHQLCCFLASWEFLGQADDCWPAFRAPIDIAESISSEEWDRTRVVVWLRKVRIFSSSGRPSDHRLSSEALILVGDVRLSSSDGLIQSQYQLAVSKNSRTQTSLYPIILSSISLLCLRTVEQASLYPIILFQGEFEVQKI